jgi:hypothetical protein
MIEYLAKTRSLIDRYIELAHRPEIAPFLKPRGKVDDGTLMLNAWQRGADMIGYRPGCIPKNNARRNFSCASGACASKS